MDDAHSQECQASQTPIGVTKRGLISAIFRRGRNASLEYQAVIRTQIRASPREADRAPVPGYLLQAINRYAEDDGLSLEARLKLESETRLIGRADRATREPRVYRTGSYLASVGLARFLNLEAHFLSEKSGALITGTDAEGLLVEGLKSHVDGFHAWKDRFETHKGADIVVLRRERLTDGLKKFLRKTLGPSWPRQIHVDRGIMGIDGDPPVTLSSQRSRLLQRACDRISVKTCTPPSSPIPPVATEWNTASPITTHPS